MRTWSILCEEERPLGRLQRLLGSLKGRISSYAPSHQTQSVSSQRVRIEA
jgi:hypothetical protein